eukprot:Amastigsp_a850978_63.p1 type:complete len:316 gc:universal Amastigsp_a850978_63:79-1026(+)
MATQQQLVDVPDELFTNPYERKLADKQSSRQRGATRETSFRLGRASARTTPTGVAELRGADRVLAQLGEELRAFTEDHELPGDDECFEESSSSGDSLLEMMPGRRKAQRDEATAALPLARVEAEATAHAIDLADALLNAPAKKGWRYFARRFHVPVSFPDVGTTARAQQTLGWLRWDKVLRRERALHKEEIERDRRTKSGKWRARQESLSKEDAEDDDEAAADFVLQETEKAEIRKIFSLLDVNHDGDVSIDELRSAMESVLDDVPSRAELEKWFKTSDVNGDNRIQLEEFVDAMRIHYMFSRAHDDRATSEPHR